MLDADRLYDAALEWRGTKIQMGQSLKGVRCDCKGLIAGALREIGRPEGRSVEALDSSYGNRVSLQNADRLEAGLARMFDRVTDMRRGDILLFELGRPKRKCHLALTDGAGRMLHAFSKPPGIVIELPMGTFWVRSIASVWRLRDDD